MSKALKLRLYKTAFDPIVARPAYDQNALEQARQGPLAVAGLFQTASGIGASARVCADALEKRGLSPLRVDLSIAFNQADIECARALTGFPNNAYGTLILHLNAPETLRGLVELGLFRFRKWRVIGYWVWEFEEAPPHWREATRYLSEIWTPTHFSAAAIRMHADIPVRVVPHYVMPPAAIKTAHPADDAGNHELRVLTAGDGRSSLSRKNLVGAIRAFRMGLGERADCRLIVKTRNLFAHAASADDIRREIADHPRIDLLDISMSEQEKWSLIRSCDIILSLHRSEGFGLLMAEAMTLGKAVIATGWSGNMDFMDANTACLAPYVLNPVDDKSSVYDPTTARRWAEPDIAAAAAFLRRLADKPDERRALGERACAFATPRLDGTAYIAALNETSF